MTLLHAAERAGICSRVRELVDDLSRDATDQISNGSAQIRAYRLARVRGRC